ncbi:MAG: hypothetical protein M0P64_01520 [Candidatus Pacebacteria bacterium]|jgi:hypothetical protein|nr:hypothetical protein [Candidatus Paceibacterota bacterium]
MKRFFILIVLLIVPWCSCYAAHDDSWYTSVGGGAMIVKGINSPTHLEQQILGTAGVVGSSTTDNKSSYNSLAVGKCININVCFEGAYIWGAEFHKDITVNSASIGVIDVGGTPIDFGTQPINLTLRQEATVSAGQLSVLGKIPLNPWLGVFARVGVYGYQIKLVSKIPIYQNMYLSEESTDSGTVPMASIGFDVRPFDQTTGRFEGQKTGRISIFSFSFIYKF